MTLRQLGEGDRDALIRMYADFEPLGVAQGVPPVNEDVRRDWIDSLLTAGWNLGVVTSGGCVLGQVILAESAPREAEIAFFVHQKDRRRHYGTRLVEAALAAAPSLGFHRIWATVLADNVPALRLLHGRGFALCSHTLPALEMETFLPSAPATPA